MKEKWRRETLEEAEKTEPLEQVGYISGYNNLPRSLCQGLLGAQGRIWISKSEKIWGVKQEVYTAGCYWRTFSKSMLMLWQLMYIQWLQ